MNKRFEKVKRVIAENQLEIGSVVLMATSVMLTREYIKLVKKYNKLARCHILDVDFIRYIVSNAEGIEKKYIWSEAADKGQRYFVEAIEKTLDE